MTNEGSSESNSLTAKTVKKQKVEHSGDEHEPSLLAKGVAIAAASTEADLNIPEDIETASDKEELTKGDISDSDLPPDYMKLMKKKKGKHAHKKSHSSKGSHDAP